MLLRHGEQFPASGNICMNLGDEGIDALKAAFIPQVSDKFYLDLLSIKIL